MWACLAVGIHERANQDSPKTDISALRQSRHKQRIYLLSHVLSALCFSWNCHIKECVRSCVCVGGDCSLSRRGSKHFGGWLLSAKIRPVFLWLFCCCCCCCSLSYGQIISLLSSRSMTWTCHWWARGLLYRITVHGWHLTEKRTGHCRWQHDDTHQQSQAMPQPLKQLSKDRFRSANATLDSRI